MRHAMSQPAGTYALHSKNRFAPIMFQSKAIANSIGITAAPHVSLAQMTVSALRHMFYERPAGGWESQLSSTARLKPQPETFVNPTKLTVATHIALKRTTVSAIRYMIYESPARVWESQLSFTAHLKRIDIPSTVHGALYRLLAARPERRLGCVDLVDIDLLLDRHLSLFVAAAPKGREREAYDALRSTLNATNAKPTICGFVNSASSEYLNLHKYYEARDEIDSFDQFRHSNISFITTNVFDEAPAQCAYRFEIWVASESGF